MQTESNQVCWTKRDSHVFLLSCLLSLFPFFFRCCANFLTKTKASVKQATKEWNLFRNIAAKRAKKRCCAFFPTHVQACLEANQVTESREYWLLIGRHDAGVTPCTGVTSFSAKQVCNLVPRAFPLKNGWAFFKGKALGTRLTSLNIKKIPLSETTFRNLQQPD